MNASDLKLSGSERAVMLWSLALIVLTVAYLALPWPAILQWAGSDASHAADWVQALGSVAAIAGGACGIVWQVKAQGRADRRLKVQQELDALTSAHTLLSYAYDSLAEPHIPTMTAKQLQDYATLTLHVAQLPFVKVALDQTDVRDVPGAWEKLAFLSGRDAFTSALSLIETMQSAIQGNANPIGGERLHKWQALHAKHRHNLGVRAGILQARIDTLKVEVRR